MIKQLLQNPIQNDSACPWHDHFPNGKRFSHEELFPDGICPILYHTIYPYFLASLYGATFKYNAKGDCNVGCPAAHGVDVLIKKRNNTREIFPSVSSEYSFIIYAEIVHVIKSCPHGHEAGQRFLFRTVDKKRYICPAGLNNIFPFLNIPIPACIDLHNLRCPDFAMPIFYSTEENNYDNA